MIVNSIDNIDLYYLHGYFGRILHGKWNVQFLCSKKLPDVLFSGSGSNKPICNFFYKKEYQNDFYMSRSYSSPRSNPELNFLLLELYTRVSTVEVWVWAELGKTFSLHAINYLKCLSLLLFTNTNFNKFLIFTNLHSILLQKCT